MITREEAIKLVKEHDHALDPLCVRDLCEFLGYTEKEFWDIVDRQYNRELFEKDELRTMAFKRKSEIVDVCKVCVYDE